MKNNQHIKWHEGIVERDQRWAAQHLGGATIWFTGLSGSGKSTLAVEVERQLILERRSAYLLDGDNLRHGLNADLGFTENDRKENIRRVSEVALLFCDAGIVSLVPLISPYRESRDDVRIAHEKQGLLFIEVFVDTPLSLCEQRDPKGLYGKARSGEIINFTGIDAPYEEPLKPEIHVRPEDGELADIAGQIITYLYGRTAP